MVAKLWVALLLTLLVNYVYTEDSDCPLQCKCRYQINSIFLSCKTLDVKLKKKVDLSIGHFMLHSDKPVTLTERIFANLGLKGVNSITITNTNILSIHKNAFRDLSYLTEVRITDTNLSELPTDVFFYNNNMKKLNISRNSFTTIKNFVKSPSIAEIDLSNNKIVSIDPTSFDKLPELSLLDLSYNQIETIPTNTFNNLLELNEIRLGHNQLTGVSRYLFDKNINLESLYLNNNPLDSLPLVTLPSIVNLHGCKLNSLSSLQKTNLKEISNLDLSNNSLTNVENVISAMSSLSIINLSGNQLSNLSDKIFFNNYNLEKIILDNNPSIVNLPQFKLEHATAFNVHWFSCENCGIRVIHDDIFKTMPTLLTLTLSHNKISDINIRIFEPLKALHDLDLSHNQIRTIDDDTFKNNLNLVTLNLAGNYLLTLHASVFRNNLNLQMLDISNCGLHQLWSEEEGNLSSIHNLNVSNNRINIIRKEDVAITENLKFIDISGNPITCSESYKQLIIYLTDHEIQNIQYTTHENIEYETFDERAKEMGVWKEQARKTCPNMKFDEDNHIDIEVNEKYETTQSFHIKEKTIFIDETDDADIDYEEEIIPPHISMSKPNEITILENIQYAFITKLMVFVLTALMVITLVVTTTMFILKRNQHLIRPRIDNIRAMSKLKKNSGLVYQPLSEEHDNVKTPVLSRFVLPTVHQKLDPNHM